MQSVLDKLADLIERLYNNIENIFIQPGLIELS